MDLTTLHRISKPNPNGYFSRTLTPFDLSCDFFWQLVAPELIYELHELNTCLNNFMQSVFTENE